MNSYLVKGMAFDRHMRMFLASNADLVRTVCEGPGIRHRLLREALGSVLTIACLAQGTLKDRQRLSLTVRTSRPPGRLFADADAEGNVRGYLGDSLAELPADRLDRMDRMGGMRELIGDRGSVQMVKDIGMSRSVTGITDMPSGRLADDMAHYYRQSEQTETWFALDRAANEEGETKRSLGLMLQALPGAPAGAIESARAAMEAWPAFASARHGSEDAEELVRAVRGFCPSFEALAVEPLRAGCGCSREAMLPLLRGLGPDELRQMVREGQEAAVRCHVCGRTYAFAAAEIRERLLGRGL